MIDPSKLAAVELTLDDCSELLADAAPSPAVRELRVRHGALARVVRGWRVMPPHAAQLAAMLECALELRGMVVRACTPPTRDPTTLPGIGPTSRPPARSSSRPRRPMSAQRSTLPPPRDMSMPTTKPPPRRRKRDG
jgi:hypothetical protein